MSDRHSSLKTSNRSRRSFSLWQLLPLLAGGLALAFAAQNLTQVSGPGCGRLWFGRYALPSAAESLVLITVGGLLVWGAFRLRAELIQKIAGRLLAVGFGLLLALLMAEAVLRLTEAPAFSVDDLILTNHDRLGYLRKSNWTFTRRSLQGEFEHTFTTDDLGLIIRDDNPNRSQPDAFRLLMVGDSLLDGLEVPAMSNLSELIEDQLAEATGQPIQVINAGHQSYDATTYYLSYLEFADTFDPEIVVAFLFVGNDFTYAPRYYLAGRVKVDQDGVPVAMYPRFDLENYTAWDVDTPGDVPLYVREAEIRPKGLRLRTFIKNKALPFVLQRTIHPICRQLEACAPSGLPDYVPDWEPCADLSGELTVLCNNYQLRNESLIRNNYVAIFKDEYTDLDWEDVEYALRPLALLNDAVERDGRRLLIVIVPQKAQIPDQPGTSYVVGVGDDEYIDSTRPQDVTLAFCESEHLTCFDLLPALRSHADQQLFWLSDQHFTEAGHQVAAEAIGEVLLDMVEQPVE